MDPARAGTRILRNALWLGAVRWGVRTGLGYVWVRAVLEAWWARSVLQPVYVVARVLWLCARSAWQTRRQRPPTRP